MKFSRRIQVIVGIRAGIHERLGVTPSLLVTKNLVQAIEDSGRPAAVAFVNEVNRLLTEKDDAERVIPIQKVMDQYNCGLLTSADMVSRIRDIVR